ncbi:MAG TPA: T9SS type A sorting domain-containing protein, partial [Bacteroidetes bacterium]|nr:T9SS type A sorting domain-containing protein [Bacteroidota bacterium]
YEVRISTTTPDTSAFMSDTALVTISGEGGLNNIRSLNLAAYANQDVYLAFRHTSEDKFVLLLDDVKVSNVNTLDIGVMDVTYGSPAPGDTVTFGLTVANYGSDTVTSFKVSWAIDGGAIKAMLVDSIKLAPNATLTFDHSSLYFSDTLDRFYDLCLWTGLPNNGTDQDINNDTLCIKLPIGSPVGAPEPVLVSASMRIFPNPFSENFSIEISGIHQQINAEIRLYDLFGKEIWVKNQFIQGNTRLEVAPGQLAAGIYLLELRSQGQHLLTRRVIHQ